MASPKPSLSGLSYVPWFFEVIAVFLAPGRLYRVRFSGRENVPATGGVLLIANHLSYADVAVLQLACPRPIRYVGYKGLNVHASGFFAAYGSFGSAGSFRSLAPIRPRACAHGDQGPAGRAISLRLSRGGGISRTGQLMEIRKGYEVMARRAKVPQSCRRVYRRAVGLGFFLRGRALSLEIPATHADGCLRGLRPADSARGSRRRPGAARAARPQRERVC